MTKRRVNLSNAVLDGRYQLARQVGVGSVGSVYEAIDFLAPSEERIAIKVIHGDLVTNAETLERFKREGLAVAKLRHPNIVDVQRLVMKPNTMPFIVMEYIDGETLHDFLRRVKRITPQHAARIVLKVLAALGAAHRAKIVHRDLRPDNIFLLLDGDDDVKVGDFGAGKLLGEATDRPLSITGMLIETMAFMPPEQALAKGVDLRADIYALAATMYFAVSGHPPIDANAPAALMEAIQNRPPRPLRKFHVEVDDEFESILDKALQKDPAARFQNAKSMALALRTWLEHAPPESVGERLGDEDDTIRYDTLEGVAAPRPRSRTNAQIGMPIIGGTFEHYKVVELLGAGGVGEVYRAEDPRTGGRSVALKVLRVARDTTQSGLTLAGANRIVHEARAAATISHPNVITVFDVGQRQDVPYLVMELIAGKTLRSYVGDPYVPIERRVEWAVDVAHALAAAHAKNVVHQDVKPENVMVRDEDGAIKVLDFGLARRVFEQDIFVRGETTERVPGTPAYMAPEQMHGEEGGALSDQFAWGVLAYEILAGSLPWTQRGGFLHLVDQILTRVPEAPSRRRPDVPVEVERVVLKALSKRPEGRFATMDDVATALRRAWAESQSPAKRDGAVKASEAPDMAVVASVEVAEAASGPSAASAEPAAILELGAGVDIAARAVIAAQSASIETAMVKVDSARRRARPLRRLVAAFVGAALAVGIGIVAPRVTTRAVQSATPASSTDVTAPDFGSTMSANADAVAAYRAGIDAVHNAAGGTARKNFDQAIKLDPSFAAAHLRKVLSTPEVTDAERENVLKARQLRDALSEHDQALLHAIEPWVGVPQDAAEVERRLVALTATRPDADYLYQLCRFRVLGGNYNGAIESCRAARAIDGKFAGAIWLEAQARLFMNETAVGRVALDECLRVSPRATSCLNDVFWLKSHDGACDAAVVDAQGLIALEPTNGRWLEQLGAASYGMDQPLGNVSTPLEKSWALRSARQVPVARARAQTKLAVLTGNFREAGNQLDVWERTIDDDNDESAHSEVFGLRALLQRELGQDAAIVGAARAFLANRAAWSPGSDTDGTIDALIALYRGGALTRREFVAARANWLARASARPRSAGRFAAGPGRQWIVAYADAVVTSEDARDALAVLPDYLPLPPDRFRDTADDELIGRTFLLAGQSTNAIPFLRRAARSCDATQYPFQHTWANLELGQAIEFSDVAGACAAYRTVFDRWAAVAASQSAHVAYVRRKALRCP